MNTDSSRSKQITLAEAVARITATSCVAMGGWSFSRRPLGVVREIVRQKIRFEELVVVTGGLETDLLVATESVERIRSFYFGMEILGMGAGLKGPCQVVEESEGSLIHGLRAAINHQSFVPLPMSQSEALQQVRPELVTQTCPYTGKQHLLVPAIRPDICFLHVAKADLRGNAVLTGQQGADSLLAQASRQTIITCDELVDSLAGQVDQVNLNELQVDAVVHLPKGAWPTSCQPLYQADWNQLIDYVGLKREQVAQWLEATQ